MARAATRRTASRRAERAARPGSEAPAAGRMSAPKSGVTVRMYRQGHGDCFLLAFRGDDGGPVYVLIDCGYKPGSNTDYGLQDIAAIVDDIKEATGRRLDLVIITHEHQDHVNGFWKKTDPYFGDFEVGEAWFAWTEDPKDTLANELRKRHGDQLLGLVAARHQLSAAGDAVTAETLDEFLSLELGLEDSAGFAAAAKDPEKSVNKQGMKLIKDKAGKKNTKYIRPHKQVLRIPGVEGVRVFALGPPYDADLLEDMDPKGAEAFPGLSMRARASFFGAAEARSDPDSVQDLHPFSRRFGVPLEEAPGHGQWGRFFTAHYGAAAGAAPGQPAVDAASGEGWRRIDNDWLYAAEDLALYLNEGINNTSLVLAFELEKSGKVLLFVGDAQRGNWKSWTKGSWKIGDETITVRDLLERTVLYKVGHHGSHNATLSGTAESDYPNLAWMGGRFGNEFTAMITAVADWAWKVKPKPWKHPLPSIKKALMEKCEGRVFQTDTDPLASNGDRDDREWKDFKARARASDLYFEYEIRDE